MSYHVMVRYGALNLKADFKTTIADLDEAEEVVVRTDRGTELGWVLAKPFEVPDGKRNSAGDVLRRPTGQDREAIARIEAEQVQSELRYCREKVREHDLPMKLVGMEHLLGGEKIIFYFVAEGRVDFRDLVKDLAGEYRTRIELKQLGVRDEARLLADLGHCGHEICCRLWMRKLEPVTMKMAKAQKATLDPTKVSGRCGRLMCCLRFENPVYEELKRNLPRKGQRVVTDAGNVEVINYDILSQSLTVEYPDERRMRIKLSEVKQVLPKVSRGGKTGNRNRPTPSGGKPKAEASGSAGRKNAGQRNRADANGNNTKPETAGKPETDGKDQPRQAGENKDQPSIEEGTKS